MEARIVKLPRTEYHTWDRFIIEVKKKFLWWGWWSSIDEYEEPDMYGFGGTWSKKIFKSYSDALTYLHQLHDEPKVICHLKFKERK
jgi:hypothetical protein